MRFATLCEAFEEIAGTSKRLEKTRVLADLIGKVPDKDMGNVMLLLRGRVYPEWDKTQIGISEKLAIKAIITVTGAPEREVISKFKKSGDLGLVAQEMTKGKRQATLMSHDLSISDVITTVRKLAGIEGHGSVDTKLKTIAHLLGNATPSEARFVVRILLEDLRIGIADGTIRDAIIWAAVREHEGLVYDPTKNSWSGKKGVSDEDVQAILKDWTQAVQNALDRSNDSAQTAVTALHKGKAKLDEIDLVYGTPTKVMLAQRSLGIEDAFRRVGRPAAVEYKYDGFRLQIHKEGNAVTLFTRRLENVTDQFPDVVRMVREHISGSCVLDAEAVGYDPKTKRHTPFQAVSQRIRRKYDIEALAKELPVEVNVFDILRKGSKAVYPLPFTERRALIEGIVPKRPLRIQPSDMMVTDDDGKVETYYKEALAAGYEGLMFKSLDAPYKPGSRVGFMVKLKPTLDTIDCVVVGAEWGEGKRSGWFTSFVLAVPDEDGQLVEIGRVGTGFKELASDVEDAVTFQEMTDLLKPLVTHEAGKEVSVKPKIVLEVKCEEIQKSPSYSSGFALRFPRVVRVRSDRRPQEASTTADVLDLFEAQKGKK